MYLKRIDIQGFKSFADRISLKLNSNDITGIVGPNGSGKSNIIDAVRWVMGEQKAKELRGEKGSDIIFAGSSKRKPLAMAEVSLVFDNRVTSPFCPPEYRHEDEIVLCRRIYLDGQREYLINRKSCRLKDLLAFLSNAGLGGRSYSIIQQGQVDRILQAKPDQLREIIEEAAGTQVFKIRREESLKRLDKNNENMSRVSDLLSELESQLGRLKEQAELALEHQKLSESLRLAEIELLQQSFLRLEKERLTLGKQQDESSLQAVACREEIKKMEQQYNELKQELNKADPMVTELTEAISSLREQLAHNEASYSNAAELIEQNSGQKQERELKLSQERREWQERKTELSSLEERVNESKQKAQDIEDSLEDCKDELEIAEEEEQVFRKNLADQEEERHRLQNLLEQNKLKQKQNQNEYSETTRALKDQEERSAEMLQNQSELQMLSESSQLLWQRSRSKVEDLNKQKQNSETNKQDLQVKLYECQQQETQQNLREQELEQGLADLDSKVEKNLLEMLAELDLNSTLISSCLSFHSRATELSPSLRQALDLWLERVLVPAAELLPLGEGLAKLGATVVPVSLIPTGEPPALPGKPWQSLRPFLEIGQDVPGLSALLDRLYYSEDDVGGTDLPKDLILFGPQGCVYHGPWDLSLALAPPMGTLALNAEKERLHAQVAATRERRRNLRTQKEQLAADLEKETKKLTELEQETLKVQEETLRHRAAMEAKQHEYQLQGAQIIANKDEYARLEKLNAKRAAQAELIAQEIKSVQRELALVLDESEDLRASVEDASERREEIRRVYENKKADCSSAQTLASTLAEHLERDTQQCIKEEKRLQEHEEEFLLMQQKFLEAQERQAGFKAKIQELLAERENLEEQLRKKKEGHAALWGQLNTLEGKLKEGRSLLEKIQKKRSEGSLGQERAQIQQDSLRVEASEKYRISLSNDLELLQENYNFKAKDKLVKTQKSKLESMGPVNMMAIDEYRQVEEREKFILEQREEIDATDRLLKEAISEIEQEALSKFMSVFTALGEEFASLFPVLFPGGQARLELQTPDTPQDSGVVIMVRLPGKSMQNMRLFSGGEKALTAIAFIFALLKSKPSPFCFLDEVDAPLDEMNVGRYNAVLNELSGRFQFIVITHRRKTMEVFDTLYGVTMQEPGVSKLVGVDLKESLPSHLQKDFSRQGASSSPTAQL